MARVSVIIPTFNRGHLILDAIKSVLNQSYKDYEIIIIDDGSTDDTINKISKYKEKIKYLKQNNKGPALARNRGIESSNGEFIAFLDSDDIWLKEKLKMQIDVLEKNKNVGLVFTDAYRVNLNNIERNTKTEFYFLKPYSGNIFNNLFRDNFIHMSTVLVRKRCLDSVGNFEENEMLTPAEDYELLLKLSVYYEIRYIKKPLIEYRIHENNISGKDIRYEIPKIIKVLEKALKLKPELRNCLGNIKNQRFSELNFSLARSYFETYELSQTRRYLMKAIRFTPIEIELYKYLFLSMLGERNLKKAKELKNKMIKNLKESRG